MEITRADVEHVAALARLGLSEEEKTRLVSQLGIILEQIAILQEVDVSQVSPSSSILQTHTVVARDHARPSDAPSDLLANAPATAENFLRVPAVLEETH